MISKEDRQIRQNSWPMEVAPPVPAVAWKHRAAFCEHANPGSGGNRNFTGPVVRVDLSHALEADVRSFLASGPGFGASGEAMETQPEFILTLLKTFCLAAANILEKDPCDLRIPAQRPRNSPVVVLRETMSGDVSHSTRLTPCPEFPMRDLLTAARDLPCRRSSKCTRSCSRCLNDRSDRKHSRKLHSRSFTYWLQGILVRGGNHLATPNFVEAG